MIVFTVTIAVGMENRPYAASQTGIWFPDYKIVGHPSFTNAISAVSSMVFAYAGTPGFFAIAAEMRNPRHYTRSLIICQTVVTVTYCVVGSVIYYYCGSYVASPAPGSAGPLIKKVAYGIALPGLLVSGIICGHIRNPHQRERDGSAHASIVASEVYIRKPSSWVEAPDLQFSCPLGRMAQLYRGLYHRRLHHCELHTGLWRSCVTDRSSPRNSDVIPAHGCHVALRQLEWAGPHNEMEAHGRMERIRYRLRYVPDDFRYLRDHQRHYRVIHYGRRLECVVMR